MKPTEQIAVDLVRRLRDKDVPEATAREKVASVRVGMGRMVFGGFLMVLSMAFVGFLFFKGQAMGDILRIGLLLFAGVPMVGGLWFVVRGSNGTSGEALDELRAMEGFASTIAKLIRPGKS